MDKVKREKPQKACAECPMARAAELIADIWTMLIIRELLTGPKRFVELAREVGKSGQKTRVNTRTLTIRLKHLEESGIVKRLPIPHEKPPRVDYKLTEKGLALSKIIDDLRSYGKRYC